MQKWYEIDKKEDMKILEESVRTKIFFNDRYYNALENILNELKEYRDKISTISEICISESKLHIEPKTAIKEIVEVLGR